MARTKTITLICITGFVAVVFTFPQVFSPPVKRLGVFVPALYGLLVAAQFIACVGLWYFKQWGARLYLLAFFAKTIFYIVTGDTGVLFYLNLLLTTIFIVFIVRAYPRMNENL